MNLGIRQIQTLAFLFQHKNTLIVPIPLHKNKLHERGYNVPTLIAQTLGQTLSFEVAHILERVVETKAQAKITNVHQREKNTAGAFQLVSNYKKTEHIILIDDVVTSGATLEAAARPLKNAGYRLIWGLSLAQEERQGGSAPESGFRIKHPSSSK